MTTFRKELEKIMKSGSENIHGVEIRNGKYAGVWVDETKIDAIIALIEKFYIPKVEKSKTVENVISEYREQREKLGE